MSDPRIRIALFCLLFFPAILSAQRDTNDSLKLKADLALTGFWQSGNVETLIFRAKSGLRIRPWRKWIFESTNSYVYQEFGRKKADEDILSLNFIFFNPDRKLFPFALGFLSTNFRREIEFRSLTGGGISYQFWNNEKYQLKLSTSVEYEHTVFSKSDFNKVEYNGQHSIQTMRATIWLYGRYQLLDKKVILTHESYYQPSLERSNNYRWRIDLGLELPIWKFLNFKVNYLQTHESIVIAGQEQGDRFLTFGFTIKNY